MQETVLCTATIDPKHVLQDESLFEPCFFFLNKLCVSLVSIKVACHKNDRVSS